MPFPKRSIAPPPFHAHQQLVDEKTHPDRILDGLTATSMNGLLGQLSRLTDYANDIFDNLRLEANNTLDRFQRAKGRFTDLSQRFSADYQTLSRFRRGKPVDNQPATMFFSAQNRDKSLVAAYRMAAPPPQFDKLDKYSTDGPCMKKFSDPSFFFSMWVAAEVARQEEMAKKKQARTDKKKKKKIGSVKREVKAAKVEKKVYSAMGAEFQPLPSDTEEQKQAKAEMLRRRESSKRFVSPMAAGDGNQPGTIREEDDQEPSQSYSVTPSASYQQQQQQYQQQQMAYQQQQAAYGQQQAYQQQSQQAQSQNYLQHPSQQYQAPPTPPSPPSLPQYHEHSVSRSVAPPPPPIPAAPAIPTPPPVPGFSIPAAPPVPAAPPIPNAPMLPAIEPMPEIEEDVGPSALQQALQGVQLRKAPPPVPKKDNDPRSQLLDQIRNAKVDKLRKVEVVQKKEEANPKGGLADSVKKLMELRQQIAGSDDESESGEDWDE